MALRPELAAFLQRAASEPFRLGEWDCAMTLANWICALTGIDPAAELRGAYSDEAGWSDLVVAAGSLTALVGRCARAGGLVEVGEALPGDVAVIGLRGVGEVGAIFTGARWVSKVERGPLAVAASRPVLGLWGLR